MEVPENPRGFFNGVFNTEKIAPEYGYFQSYVKIAAELGPAARVCEIGVETGESLRMWQALFPAGDIAGVDISKDSVWPKGTHRIVAGQDDSRLPELVGPRNLIVDDASHIGHLTRTTFDLLWQCISPGGYYVIEDWMVAIDPKFQPTFDSSMLGMAQGLLLLLDSTSCECESVTYRYGMIIVKRKA